MNYNTKWEVLDLCGNILEPYTCRFCEFTTNFRVDLQKHVGTCNTSYYATHDIEAVVLTIPEFEYADSSTEQTKQEHATKDVKTFKCNQCNYGTDTRKKYGYHLRNKHNIGRITWHQCDQCSYKCKYNSSLKSHRSFHHTVQWFTCTLCDYKTKSEKYLICHRINKHVSEEQIQWFPCDQCDFKAKTKISFQRHKRVHKVDNWLKCDQCEYTTPSRWTLKTHQFSKHLEKNQIEWISCKQCDFKAKLQDRMTKHEKRMHRDQSEMKWYNCAQCNFRSKQKSGLKEHETKHYPLDQIQWHRCQLCRYRGRTKSLLNSHFKSAHEGNKRKRVSGPRFMKCEHCPYETTKTIHMQEHLKSIHPEITAINANNAVVPAVVSLFKCGACQFSANNQNAVVSHIMTTHVSIVPLSNPTPGNNVG